MRKSIACLFAAALVFTGCSKDIEQASTPLDAFPYDFNPSEMDSPLEVSGLWTYRASATKHDCPCQNCHDDIEEGSMLPSSVLLPGERTILQEYEDLHILDHSMGVRMTGNIRVFTGDYLCGVAMNDDPEGNRLSYSEYGKFYSDTRYVSVLTITFSNDEGVCRTIWSVDGDKSGPVN